MTGAQNDTTPIVALPSAPSNPSFRQIRALYDSDTITVYQAYSAQIASAAVALQRLSASPNFSLTRMTWIKPSWNWMMYRSGYSYKDERQAHILAIRMKRERFEHLLSLACVTNNRLALSDEERRSGVRVQWDPERDVALGKLDYRSIQIGIGATISAVWAEEWIESIEDVTELAREIQSLVQEGMIEGAQALVPRERPYPISGELQKLLGIT